MKKYVLLTWLIVFCGLNSWSQIVYEKGYFIKETDERIQCLIKNIDRLYNPSVFKYKTGKDSPDMEACAATVKEFGIDGTSKYVRAVVKIDKSDDAISRLSRDRQPQFNEEILFLKVLVEGGASLYIHRSARNTRFFYKKGDSEIQQLVYKQYMTDDGIATNDEYKKQLFISFQSEPVPIIQNLSYTTSDLKRFFIHLNEKSGAVHMKYENENRFRYNLTLRPGISSANFKVQAPVSFYNTDFEPQQSYRFGIESELVLPFHKNKWGILVEPAYQYFQAEHPASLDRFSTRVNYRSVEFACGIRHYFYLADNSKIFMNSLLVYDFDANSKIQIIRFEEFVTSEFDIKSRGNIAAGIGYKLKDRYSIELRYFTKRDLLGEYNVYEWYAGYHAIAFSFGYTL